MIDGRVKLGAPERVILLTTYLWSHPIWCSDECVPPSDGSVELCTDTEVDQFDLSIVRQENILAFDVSVYDFAGMKVSQTTKNLPKNTKMHHRSSSGLFLSPLTCICRRSNPP